MRTIDCPMTADPTAGYRRWHGLEDLLRLMVHVQDVCAVDPAQKDWRTTARRHGGGAMRMAGCPAGESVAARPADASEVRSGLPPTERALLRLMFTYTSVELSKRASRAVRPRFSHRRQPSAGCAPWPGGSAETQSPLPLTEGATDPSASTGA